MIKNVDIKMTKMFTVVKIVRLYLWVIYLKKVEPKREDFHSSENCAFSNKWSNSVTSLDNNTFEYVQVRGKKWNNNFIYYLPKFKKVDFLIVFLNPHKY